MGDGSTMQRTIFGERKKTQRFLKKYHVSLRDNHLDPLHHQTFKYKADSPADRYNKPVSWTLR